MSYVPQVSHSVEHMSGATLGALAVALVLFALLLVLGVTSFNFVKKRMRKESWKRVQMLAYPFFLLVYAHLLLMLLPRRAQGRAGRAGERRGVLGRLRRLRLAAALSGRQGRAEAESGRVSESGAAY